MPNFVPRLTKEGMTTSARNWYYEGNIFYQTSVLLGLPNCTCYAYGRYAEARGKFANLPTGNATDWFNAATNFQRSTTTPALGAVICWGSTSASYPGHVGVVEKIYENGDIDVSMSAYTSTNKTPSNPLYFWVHHATKASGYSYTNPASYFQGFIYNDWGASITQSNNSFYLLTYPPKSPEIYESYFVDQTYRGHRVSNITDREKQAIVYQISREQNTTMGGAVSVAQIARDIHDYMNPGFDFTWRTLFGGISAYSPFPNSRWYESENFDINSAPIALAAYRWVFELGNSAYPAKLFAYAGTSTDWTSAGFKRCYKYWNGSIGVQAYWWTTDNYGSYINPSAELDNHPTGGGVAVLPPAEWQAKSTGAYSRDSYEALQNAICTYRKLLSLGWTVQAVCGLLGNLEPESGYNPWRWESDDVPAYPSTPSYGYGLVQFTPSSKYISDSNAQGYSGYGPNWSDRAGNRNDGDAQLQYISNYADYYETTDYPLTFSEFKSSSESAGYLASAWLYNYERPADPSATESTRIQAAEYWYAILSGYDPPTPPPSTRSKKVLFTLCGSPPLK